MMAKRIFFIVVLLISSCGSKNEIATDQKIAKTNDLKPHKEKSDHTNKSINNVKKDVLSLDDFSGIPSEIDGCSCYFSKTDTKFKENVYVFAAGFDSIGFVSINKKLVRLNLVSTEREPNSFGDYDHFDVYESDLYKITVDVKFKKYNGEETWWNYGTIVIETKDGQKVSEKFVGECGC